MFARPPDDPRADVALTIDGGRVLAETGGFHGFADRLDRVAAALLGAGRLAFRATPVSGRARGPFCMMGMCFDCLVTIDGVTGRQACMVAVAEGMRVETLPLSPTE